MSIDYWTTTLPLLLSHQPYFCSPIHGLKTPKKTQPKTLSQQAPDCWKMLGTTFMYICHHAGETSSPCSRNPDHLQSFHQKIDKILTILVKGHTSSRKIWPIPKTWTSASPLQWLVSSTKVVIWWITSSLCLRNTTTHTECAWETTGQPCYNP
jgi:hypothetical protein